MNRLIGLYSNQTTTHTRERKREGEREGSSLLSCTSLEPYYKAEEEFMKCLTDFAKKQFLPVSDLIIFQFYYKCKILSLTGYV